MTREKTTNSERGLLAARIGRYGIAHIPKSGQDISGQPSKCEVAQSSLLLLPVEQHFRLSR